MADKIHYPRLCRAGLPVRTVTDDEVARMRRDMVYFYHEMAMHGCICGDILDQNLYNLPYWEWLEFEISEWNEWEAELEVDASEVYRDESGESLIREGCMFILLVITEACMSGQGGSWHSKLSTMLGAVEAMPPRTEREARFRSICLNSLAWEVKAERIDWDNRGRLRDGVAPYHKPEGDPQEGWLWMIQESFCRYYRTMAALTDQSEQTLKISTK